MGKKRAEDRDVMDVVMETGVDVKFGGETLEMKPLKIGADMAWREKLGEMLGRVVSEAQGLKLNGATMSALRSGDLEAIGKDAKDMLAMALGFLMGRGFDEALALLRLYTPAWPWERLMDRATRAEVMAAIRTMLEMEYDFFAETIRSLLGMARIMKKTPGTS